MSGSETISTSGVPARFRSMAGHARVAFVQALARVLFQVRARDADALALPSSSITSSALGDDGQLVLADLVALGQIRIEVILAREHRAARDGGTDRQTELHRHAHRRLFNTGSTPG